MKPNKTGYFSHPKILLGFILLIVAATAIFLTTRPEETPYSFFSDSFGLALPEHTEVLFEEDAYGAMGDGYRLYAFSLPPGERDAFLSQGAMARWSPLPLPEDVAQALRERVQAIGSLPGKELARDLFRESGNRQGFYCILSSWHKQPGAVLNHAHFDQDIPLFQNIVVGMVDLQDDAIYYYSWNQ